MNKSIRKAVAAAAAVACMTASTALQASTSIWISDEAGNLATVHSSSGAVHVVGSMGRVMTDIAISPGGSLFGIDGSNLYRINPFTASSTLVGSLGTSANSLTFGTDGTLYLANDNLYKVSTVSGHASLIGNAGTSYASSGDLTFFAGSLYLSGGTMTVDDLIRLDPSTGAGTLIGSLGLGSVFGLAADDIALYGLSNKNVYTIDPTTGATTLLSTFTGDAVGATWGAATAPVPEPETYALMLFGIGALGLRQLWTGRRREKT